MILKFHGGVDIDIILFLWALQVDLKHHAGRNLYITLSLSTCQVSLKFHGGGNLDTTAPLRTSRVSLKFQGGANSLVQLVARQPKPLAPTHRGSEDAGRKRSGS